MKRQPLSAEAKADAYNETFSDTKFRTVPDGTILILGSHDILEHEIDGAMKGSTPVVYAYYPSDIVDGKPVDNANPVVIYLMALTREHLDYQNNHIVRKGTFNLWVKQYVNKTKGDICRAIDAKQGTEIMAKIVHYYTLNTKGEVVSVYLNDFDFVE